jgi:hypothetical protein
VESKDMHTPDEHTPPTYTASQASRDLSYVIWHTAEPMESPAGAVYARGEAHVRVPEPDHPLLPEEKDAEVAAVQRAILQALADVLQGADPAAGPLAERTAELADQARQAANRQLAAGDIAIEQLTIVAIEGPDDR